MVTILRSGCLKFRPKNLETYFFRKSALPPLLESLAKGEKDAANMVLAYEISVNDEFELDKEDPAEDSVQGQIKSTVERAFWDVVRDNIKNGDDEMVLPMIR